MHTNAYVCKYALYTCTQFFFFFITLNVSIPEKHYMQSLWLGGMLKCTYFNQMSYFAWVLLIDCIKNFSAYVLYNFNVNFILKKITSILISHSTFKVKQTCIRFK